MKNSTLWIAGSALFILTGIIIVGAYFFLVEQRQQPDTEPTPTGTYFPTNGGISEGTSESQTRSLALSTGKRIAVKDFLANGVTFKDPANQGAYYLAGKLDYCLEDGTCPDTNTPAFSILYLEEGQNFSISLNSEPLKSSRIAAERYLMAALGISEQQMCELEYTLGTTVSVNEAYGSITNLGFSFCEGAIPLP
ncbi:MAG: hypothetical protein QG636_608 [Patescibacteria group bacterium]|nr:hypothetical protein [Patescibacteria group bacterium]